MPLPFLRRRRSLPGKPLSTSLLYIAAILFATACAGIAVFLLPHTRTGIAQAAPAAPRPALTVTLEAQRTVAWDSTVAAEGVIEPVEELVIGAQTGGLPLVEVRVNVGDTVRRGDVLARFDAALPRMETAQLEAALAQSQAAARHAVTVRDRMRALGASGAVSKQDMQQSEMQADTADAQVRLVQAQLDTKRQLLRYAEVRAPDDGIVSARTATPGAVANAGQELFRVIRQGRLEWRGELTPAQLAFVRPGQAVTLTLPDGSAAAARVRQSAPRLAERTRLATVYAELPPGGRARAGMYAAGSIAVGTASAVVVPSQSVVVRDGRTLVFTLDPRVPSDAVPAVKAVPIVVGRRRGGATEIVAGLAPQARVVGQGAAFLRDGDGVRVQPAAAPRSPEAFQ